MYRILLVDDHPIVRQGIRRTVESDPAFTVAGEFGRAYDAIAFLGDDPVDALILDVSLPDMNGIEALRALRSSRPELPVLVLTMHDEQLYAVRALREGACAYLTKSCSPQELLTALHKVCEGGHYLTPSVAERLALAVRVSTDQPLHACLSLREFEVMRLIGRGRLLKDIAEQLHLSPKTITTYRTRILAKMKLPDNEAIIQYAVRNGLVD